MPKVAIDAGHGIETAGKRAFDGSLLEYQFNRDISARQEYHLKRHGCETLLIAPDEHDVPIGNPTNIRAKKANDWKADIFISNHGNAFGDTWNSANGWEILICATGGNAEKLAKLIHKYSIPYLGLTDRGIKVQNLAVTRDTNMPAVLVEHGFYSNQNDLAKMKTEEFKEKCAIADVKGILEYFGIVWKDETFTPPQPTIDYKALSESLQNQLANKDKIITDISGTIDGKNKAISDLSVDVNNKNKEISSLNEKVKQFDDNISVLNDEIMKLKSDLVRSNMEISRLNGELIKYKETDNIDALNDYTIAELIGVIIGKIFGSK